MPHDILRSAIKPYLAGDGRHKTLGSLRALICAQFGCGCILFGIVRAGDGSKFDLTAASKERGRISRGKYVVRAGKCLFGFDRIASRKTTYGGGKCARI